MSLGQDLVQSSHVCFRACMLGALQLIGKAKYSTMDIWHGEYPYSTIVAISDGNMLHAHYKSPSNDKIQLTARKKSQQRSNPELPNDLRVGKRQTP